MKPGYKLALAVAGWFAFFAGVLGAYLFLLWSRMDIAQRGAFGRLFAAYSDTLLLLSAMLVAALGFVLVPVFRRYVIAPRQLAEGTRIIATANPSHRLPAMGSVESRDLAAAINLLADRYEAAIRDVEARAADSSRVLEQEKNQLAALVAELTHSVIVCNLEGRILLYNEAARELYAQPGAPAGANPVGLGRSVFALVDRAVLAHALERLDEQVRREVTRPAAHFVATGSAGTLLRVHMAPVKSHAAGIAGYILTFGDARTDSASARQRDELLMSVEETSRSCLGGLQAAADALARTNATPDRDRFVAVIGEEVGRLARTIEAVTARHAELMATEWPLEETHGSDLLVAAGRHIERVLKLAVEVQVLDEARLRVDSYALVQTLTWIAGRLRDETGTAAVRLGVSTGSGGVRVDVGARGALSGRAHVSEWERSPMALPGNGAPRTLRDVLDRHGAEAWWEQGPHADGFVRLLFPMAPSRDRRQAAPLPYQSRPEYYDFDLFRPSAASEALESRALAELAYTVFDTETTGLDPSHGDEIISIGAVRIVNGRLLAHEAFEQLVDPGRPLSPESRKITGIDGAMLRGLPRIEDVLPLFHRYCEDTILVAHNAAFDLRFLELKEKSSGVRFTQPVLDTLLLSAMLHPTLEAHTLEAIAARLGVSVMGRHTALGDAMVTAELFLRMIPQLAERGVRTLKDAQEAARRTYYARLRY